MIFSFLNPGQDIYLNEHQLSFVTYEYLIGFISTEMRFLYAVNLLQIIGTEFCDLEADRPVFWTKSQDKSVCDTFSFLFLPQFFFLAFAYGIIRDCFRFWHFCFWINLLRAATEAYDIVCHFCNACSYFERNNIIGSITIAILYFSDLKRKNRRLILLLQFW